MSDIEMDAADLKLLALPNEVLQTVLQACHGQDLAALSRSCRTLRNFILKNDLLWRDVYLSCYDGPPPAPRGEDEIVWKEELQNVVRVGKILASRDAALKRAELPLVCRTSIKLLQAARGEYDTAANVQLLRNAFDQNSQNQDIFCCSSTLFRDAGNELVKPADNAEDCQTSAHMHCLFGAPRWGWGPPEPEGVHDLRGLTYSHSYARARVYDLRRYSPGTFWGPFKDDGKATVDWEKMEAIITVLGYNLKIFNDRSNGALPPIWIEEGPFKGGWPYSYQPLPQNHRLKTEPLAGAVRHFIEGEKPQVKVVDEESDVRTELAKEDPYGITGTWYRIVCFLDYYDFFAFNFRSIDPPIEEDRQPLDQDEAIRLIEMQFEVTKIEPPGENDGKDLPVVHFSGVSRAMPSDFGDPNANSEIRGTVRQTLEGEIRWTTYSVYSGEARWKSEGIQIGGLQSGRGVIGNWFDKDFDPRGPAGPTAFWKVSNEVDKSRRIKKSNPSLWT